MRTVVLFNHDMNLCFDSGYVRKGDDDGEDEEEGGGGSEDE